MSKPCTIDDCDGNHCPKCQRHTIGRLERGEVCDHCEIEAQENETPDADGLTASGRLHRALEIHGID
jgi:hypothetical protein